MSEKPTPAAERPTPITDAVRNQFRGDTGELCRALIRNSNDLERQLAEAREQRDLAIRECETAREDRATWEKIAIGGELRRTRAERERNQAIEQRDTLAEALRWLDSWMGSKSLLECANKVRSALATLDRKEGGP